MFSLFRRAAEENDLGSANAGCEKKGYRFFARIPRLQWSGDREPHDKALIMTGLASGNVQCKRIKPVFSFVGLSIGWGHALRHMMAKRSRKVPVTAVLIWSVLAVVAGSAAASSQAVPVSNITATPLLKQPAKQVFGAIKAPISMQARAIGTYARGCLAGAQALPVEW